MQPRDTMARKGSITSLSIAYSFGTLASGGEFESIYVTIMVSDRDTLAGAETFELEDLEAARARFEKLRAACERR
jgi:hypothetical protein